MKLVLELDDQTILLVVGDHGMKDDGNHGGSTDAETNTALLVFSKQSLIDVPASDRQIAIAPTLSLLLNVSVPTNCLS